MSDQPIIPIALVATVERLIDGCDSTFFVAVYIDDLNYID